MKYQSHSNTSYAAARAIEATSDTLRGKVYRFIFQCGPKGATDEEIQEALNGTRNKAALAIKAGDVPVMVKMDGDDGINAEFHVDDWKVIFNLMGAKRKR
jgi:hypothetical protein